MEKTPAVSIIVPAFNDADRISSALDSCLRQTLAAIEVIVVDDASTDGTAEVVQRYIANDPRVRLIRQPHNGSAYQARRAGIIAAKSDYVLFLDGDDELIGQAAEVTFTKATATHADLVQFGIEVVHRDGHTGGRFEARLQPRHDSLTGVEVLRGLFPIDGPAQGQVWKYLFRRQLLADAYALMPTDLVLPRVNDLPIAFLAAALATRYASVPDRLYRYHFGRGGSGQRVRDLETAAFYAGAIRSVDSIESAVSEIARGSADTDLVLSAYASVRRAIIGYTTHYLAEHTDSDLLDEVFTDLYGRAPARDIVQSTARYWPDDIDTLAAHPDAIHLPTRPVRSILLATNHLRTGGISNVIVSQARILRDAGYRVTIVAREPGSDVSLVPFGVTFAEVSPAPLGDAVAEWGRMCADHEIDLVLEHQWQYSRTWHAFALASRVEGAATIGWSHNFAGRSLLLGLHGLEAAPRYFPLLSHLVVLSPLDVAYWKLRGMPRVSYLPNPPSSVLLDAGVTPAPKAAPSGRRIELVWWGRLQERTKRVTELLDVAEHLERMGVDFRLRIIGPNWRDMKVDQLNTAARERGLDDRVQAVGPLHGADLLAAIDSSDILISTSVIEGYPLTIPEAQARGLAVAMYELPWLALAVDNGGIVTVPQGDAEALARQVAEVTRDSDRYTRMSAASINAAHREFSREYSSLYLSLITDTLPAGFSPEPTTEDVQQIIGLCIRFTELRGAPLTPSRSPLPNSPTTRPDPHASPSPGRLNHVAQAVLKVAPRLGPVVKNARRLLSPR